MFNHTTQRFWGPLQGNGVVSLENNRRNSAVTLVSLTRVHRAVPWPPGGQLYQSLR
jgi:hypothetical protein